MIFWRCRFIATCTKPLVEFKPPLVIAVFFNLFLNNRNFDRELQ